MKCVVLAAGEGKRMHPLTYTRPKVMLPVANKPLLEWNLNNSKKAGFKDFVFIISYKSNMVRDYFGNGSKWNVNIEYVNQGKALGTAHAIGSVRDFVDDFIVVSGDTIFGVNEIRKIKNQMVSMGITRVDNAEQYGIVECENDNYIKKIYEKTTEPFTNIINAGIYNFTSSIFQFIDKTKKSPRGEFEITDTLNMLAKTEKIKGILLDVWRDVVYPWHLLESNIEILQNLEVHNEGSIEKGAILHGFVRIGKNTKIASGSYIQGPVVIGKNCRIGPNCYIRPYTSIGNNCHIGNACEVKNTIIFDYTNIPHQNYVGDSIIGENCNLGSGTKIANLRLDKKFISFKLNNKIIMSGRRKLGAIIGDNVQTGINATINIGTNIGNDVYIGPGSIVQGEIQPFSKIL
jgi:bifunctional UDP-N-acetylglucosamine pyrophosphorylase/glucosamine-1-phosphate N-acetyltransferase